MQLNFSLKKAWTDLFDDRKHTKELLLLWLLLIILYAVGEFTKLSLLPVIAYVLLGGYFVLMSNNIINGREPVLADILSDKTENRNIIAAGLKPIGIGFIYGLVFGIFWGLISLFFTKILMFSALKGFVTAVLISLPVLIIVSIFVTLLFSENLKFSDGFNLKRAFISFKYAWREYLVTLCFQLLMNIVAIIVLFIFCLFVGIIIGLITTIFKTAPALTTSLIKELGQLIGMVVGSLFGLLIGYFYSHLLAQSYKYSLTKMD